MKTKLFLLSLVLVTQTAVAKEGEKHKHSHKEHRHHKAHQHGHAEMSIAFDGMIGKISLESPADNILGFENKPKNDQQKKQSEDALLKLETQIAQMVQMDPSLLCVMQKHEIQVNYEDGGHSDVEASFEVKCQKSPLGTKMKFEFQKHFPRLKNIEVQVLVDQISKSIQVKKATAELEIK